ncbi:MAG: winged helix DNA-binding protein [Thermoguttaceae bacterium]|nr:winged helix DNA-binding protein [Thermoguttaceae bacterium]
MEKSKKIFPDYDPCSALFITVNALIAYGDAVVGAKRNKELQSLFPRQKMALFVIEASTRLVPDGVPLSTVARTINIPLPSASQLIETLVKKNLVSRTTNPENHRSVRITLTELGRKLTREIVAVVDGKLRELQEGLSPAEIAAFDKVILHCFSRKNDVLK